MKFKSDIEVQAGLKDSSGAAGTSGQVLSSTASGVSWVSQSGFVPYTGATGDVDLGIHQLKADSLAVSTTSIEGVNAGEIVWNSIDGTFDMGLIGGVTLQAGQEMYIYGKATGTILNGEAVMFAGIQGDHILIARADAATINANPEYFIGVSTQDFATNDFGYVTVFGNVRGLDTTAYTLGAVLYYNSASATDGLLTSAVPTAPNAKIEVAAVIRVHATQGILLVRPHVMPKIKDIQDVYAPSPSNDNGLWWNASTSRYENNSIAGILGYTPADDANVVKLTGNQTINGEKTFAGTIYSDNATYLKQYTSFSNQTDYTNIGGQPEGIYIGTTSVASTISMTNLTAFRAYELPDASGTIALTSSLGSYVPYTGATGNVNLGSYSITANSFVKLGGNSTQYLKADGSVSTAMNSRIEVNFIATSGQTTFTTPYEVGQIDVYYNGSKLYPNEFTATNGTDVVLATAATLNAQISIVKYVAALSTTAVRNETTFTTTSGQTTFAVNYTPGQVDVFYNGSKLNISEFTAVNGTSVVLGFACAAGESIVIDSYVNQVSGASGTANRVAKFTGTASLGDSSISDNGTVVSLTNSDSRLYGGDNVGRFIIGNPTVNTYLAIYGSSHATLPNFAQIIVNNLQAISMYASGNIFIGSSPSDAGYKLDVNGTGRFSGALTTASPLTIQAAAPYIQWKNVAGTRLGYIQHDATDLSISTDTGAIRFTNSAERMRITSGGNVGIGTTSTAVKLEVAASTGSWISGTFSGTANTDKVVIGNLSTPCIGGHNAALNAWSDFTVAGANIKFSPFGTEKMRLSSDGDLLVGTTSTAGLERAITISGGANGGYIVQSSGSNRLYVWANPSTATIESTSGIPIYIKAGGSGGVYLSSGATSWTANSDNRLKDINYTIENAVEKLCTLNAVSFSWKSDEDKKEVLGLIAQDVEKVFPQIIDKNKLSRTIGDESEVDDTEYLGVRYQELIPILVKAIQEQQAQIKELQDELVLLKNK